MSGGNGLRLMAIGRMKAEEMLQVYRVSAAKKQAQFFWVTRGTSPKVTRESIEEEAQRLLSEWKRRRTKALPSGKVSEEVLSVCFEESPKQRGNFECSRCYKTFASHARFLKHVSNHYSGGSGSFNAVLMAEKVEGRGLEHSSRKMSEAEREDLRYFLNDGYQ